jgi:hypothetical protein
MEVPNQRRLQTTEMNSAEPGGHELIEKVVTLSGLPEHLAHQELTQILAHSGQESGKLTLEELRTAMLTYLEALAEQEEALEAGADDGSAPVALRAADIEN